MPHGVDAVLKVRATSTTNVCKRYMKKMILRLLMTMLHVCRKSKYRLNLKKKNALKVVGTKQFKFIMSLS